MRKDYGIYKNIINKWERELSRIYKNEIDKHEGVKIFSESGIPLKLAYSPLDIDDIRYEEIGMPGLYPFTREFNPAGFTFTPSMKHFGFGQGLPEDTKKLMDLAIKSPDFVPEQANLQIFCHVPAIYGFDPDDPIAHGRVGHSGVVFSNKDDFKILLDDVPIDKVSIYMSIAYFTIVIVALYIAYAEERGIPQHLLRGSSCNRLWKTCFYSTAGFPPHSSIKLVSIFLKYCIKYLPAWTRSFVVEGYSIREQGINAVQELIALFSTMIGFGEYAIKDGVNPRDYLSRVGCVLSCHNDFFEEIAKFRACRKIWATTAREKFGCKSDDDCKASPFALHTAGSSLTAQQPLNNIIRITAQTIAASLGGIGFIDPAGYDEALSTPAEQSQILRLRTTQILRYESKLGRVIDPLGGSYFIENLTKRMEEQVYKGFEEVEKQGGFLKCWETGWWRRWAEDAAYKWREEIQKKERIMIGVNEFVTNEEIEVPTYQPDPKIEKIAINRIKKYKKGRDHKKLDRRLKELIKVARSAANGNKDAENELMLVLIDAARADATLGEMSAILKDAFGWAVFE